MDAPSGPDDEPVDASVRALVDALDAIPGVTTLSSCGGHDVPDAHPGSVGASEFYVAFEVTADETGWAALDRIAWAIREREVSDEHSAADDLLLVAWHDNGSDAATYQRGLPGLGFEVRGLDFASPAALARMLAGSMRAGRRRR